MTEVAHRHGAPRSRDCILAASAALLLHGLALWLALRPTADAPVEAPRILAVSLLAAPAPPAPPPPPAPPVAQRVDPAAKAPPTPPRRAERARALAVKRPVTPAPRTVDSAPAMQQRPLAMPASTSAPADVVALPSTVQSAPAAAPAPFVAPRFDAAYLKNPPPPYPPLSRRLGEQGRVMVRVFVDTSGAPAQIELRESSGHRRLDDAAASAVRRWRFVPARRGTEPVGAWVLVPISFNLRS